jgi:hypothetical protein
VARDGGKDPATRLCPLYAADATTSAISSCSTYCSRGAMDPNQGSFEGSRRW